MNIRKNNICKFFKLSNGQWLKVVFEYKNTLNGWFFIIILANSKRECNDCLNKSSLSPKRIYGKITGRKLGLEALLIAKRELLKFEDRVNIKNIPQLVLTKVLE